MPVRIVSGGQTGVDRAALDVALELGIPCGGWVPRGRRAKDGPIPSRYPVQETASRAYRPRTRANARDSDATLILTRGAPTGGTALTVECADSLGRPWLIVDFDAGADPHAVRRWLQDNDANVLNVAGPRASTVPGIYDDARGFLLSLLSEKR